MNTIKNFAVRCKSDLNPWMDCIMVVPEEKSESVCRRIREEMADFEERDVCFGDVMQKIAKEFGIMDIKFCDYDEENDEVSLWWVDYLISIHKTMPMFEIDIGEIDGEPQMREVDKVLTPKPAQSNSDKKVITRKEFNDRVWKQYKAYENRLLKMSKKELIGNSYSIAAVIAIRDFLTECDREEIIEKLFPYADNILNDIVNEEENFDVQMWTDFDNLAEVCESFLENHED